MVVSIIEAHDTVERTKAKSLVTIVTFQVWYQGRRSGRGGLVASREVDRDGMGRVSRPGSVLSGFEMQLQMANRAGARLKALAHPLVMTALALTVVAFGWRWPLLRIRWIDPDEFQHLHAAWYISQGLLPFRDFFEHHTPLFHFALAPSYAFFDVASNPDDAIGFLFFARTGMWVLTGVVCVLVATLGTLWRDARVGAVAMLLLANTIMFLEKTLEVRPDTLALMFWLICLLATLNGIRTSPTHARAPWLFFASGALLAAGILSTQKLLLAMSGFGLAMVWYVCDFRSPGTVGRRLALVAWQATGFAVPIVLMLAYFARAGALPEFIQYNLLLNADWSEVRFSPAGYLKRLVVQNPELVAFGAVGTLLVITRMFRRDAFLRGDYVIALSLVGLIVGLFVLPIPYRQYYLTFLPLVALMAARTLVDGLDWLASARDRMPWASNFACGTAALALTAAALYPAFRFALQSMAGPLAAFVLILAVVALAVAVAVSLRAEAFAAAVFIAALSTYPFQQMQGAFAKTNVQQLTEVRYILEHTSPSDTVMDGWSGLDVFRPHAYYHHFLHDETRAMLSDSDRASLLQQLQSGEIAPAMIVLDRDLRRVSPEITAFFREHYEPTNVGAIWRRRTSIDGSLHDSAEVVR